MLSRLRAVCSEILRIWLTSMSVIVSTFILRISVNVTAHFANNVTGGFTRLRGV